ncbi:Flp family type IVb pilin [Sphingorhabdus sp.]|uniref:Flp family type IVb pilin n=1 Tax=Sphingorhabdus sp. TaxID=1902408 RepID=UPI0035B078F1
MIKFATSFLRDDNGASAAEYALILAIVGTGIAIAAVNLGGSITTAMNEAGDCIESPPAAGATTANC